MSDVLTLDSDGLLSKWGFNDGDMPDEVYDALDAAGVEFDDVALDERGWHRALVRLVREYLVPVLEQQVEVVEYITAHNPIRVATVDGLDVRECWYGRQAEPTLVPDSVEVPMVDVVRVCREVASSDAG